MRVVRWDVARRTRDTVARFQSSVTPPSMKESDIIRDASGRVMGYRPGPMRPFMARNTLTVSGDGRIGIVLAQPYHVEIVDARGRRAVGPPTSYTPTPVTQAEKDAFITEATKPVPTMLYGRGGERTTTFRAQPAPKDVEWADVLPPFGYDAARFASDGMLWVLRSTRAGAPPLYDVFDAAAKRAFQLELPLRSTVVGFGKGTVYLARADDDDVLHLERYPLPPSRAVRP
jgi:hypothetical protein